MNRSLQDSLLFHAPFLESADAAFASGDGAVQTITITSELPEDITGVDRDELLRSIRFDVVPGLASPSLTLSSDGPFGGALQFNEPDASSFVIYPAQGNIAYAAAGFEGSLSVWIRCDASAIGGQYADPWQIGDKDATNSSIWVDFTRNDDPPDFRVGIFGDAETWDVTRQRGKSEEFFFRLLKVAEPPFSGERWTHVVVTWESLNTDTPGRGRLYLNGQYAGATGGIAETIVWNIEQTAIRLGSGPFVGSLADVATFSHALDADQVAALFALKEGVCSLY